MQKSPRTTVFQEFVFFITLLVKKTRSIQGMPTTAIKLRGAASYFRFIASHFLQQEQVLTLKD